MNQNIQSPKVSFGVFNIFSALHQFKRKRSSERRSRRETAKLVHRLIESKMFDEKFYCSFYPEVAGKSVSPFDHFVQQGLYEGRRPSLEFDGAAYLALYPDVANANFHPLKHYLEFGRHEGRSLPAVPYDRNSIQTVYREITESGLFDAEYYLSQNPSVRESGRDPILHYLIEGFASYQEPSLQFSTRAYLALNPELLRGSSFPNMNPLLHYIRFGTSSAPLPRDISQLRLIQTSDQARLPNQDVTLERMAGHSFFTRFGFSYEPSGPATYLRECAEALASVQPSLKIEEQNPDVSIVIPVYGQVPFVLNCLDSLAQHTSRFSVEIIVHDDASPAEHMTELLSTIPWIRYVRRPSNGGFLDCCNSGADIARGAYIVLLNSDTRLVAGWLDELIGHFTLFPKAGFVGSKLIYPDGSLQEAGGIYWADGTVWNYGRGQDPARPEYCFARQVDYVSGAAIALPMAIWREVGGFDEAFRPAYCEDVDLAFRVREKGYQVWYQPLSQVIHYEGITHGRDENSGIKAYQVVNLRRLQTIWAGKLPGARPGGYEPDREANRSATNKMLVIDANTHMPDRDAGSFVASQMMGAFRDLGYHQSFVALHGCRSPEPYTSDYQRIGVEMLYAPFIRNIDDILRDRTDYDYVLIYRYGIAQEVIDAIRRAIPTARILFSNVDLHFVRSERFAALRNDRSLKIAASLIQTEELDIFARVDCSLVHTPVERDIVQCGMPAPLDNIVVFPWISPVRRQSVGLAERRHIMFLGSFPHAPNGDAVEFFMAEVWPTIVGRLPEDVKFLIVGNAPTERIRSFASDRVVVTGRVAEVEPYLDQARVFVAPLRYGAGIKGKVIQSLANGVPTVATSIASEGIGLVDGEQCVVADTAAAIGEAILRLYADSESWHRLQESGYQFVEDNFSWNRALELCRESLDVADTTWLKREAVDREGRVKASIMRTHGKL